MSRVESDGVVGGLESVLIGLLSGSCKTASGGVSSFISR